MTDLIENAKRSESVMDLLELASRKEGEVRRGLLKLALHETTSVAEALRAELWPDPPQSVAPVPAIAGLCIALDSDPGYDKSALALTDDARMRAAESQPL